MNGSEWLITAISNFGFPIVITGYLLIRFEKKIENLNDSIQALAQVIRDGGRNK
ncbi:YvrJ protein family protein [Paenibacillus uliginis N3/975]|uniref:YvrJ protein family protein n=1 Tax=Paenibacillus uliginis N3/975 TaxID=1313296 RepID=A0A1X7H1W8_9BACL|nr:MULTISPECIES: YvrJ family protein [Paenibacillus]UNK17130.1 YvrJ family protein [Paenibacillus sp. N3/727]SMF77988.1 YvrJ protein family protein [Paenibacillus uliginis N3/975]